MAVDISDHLVAKIDERCRRLDQVDQAIAEMRRLQQEIAPLLRSPTAIEKRIMESVTRGGIQLHGRILDAVFLSKRDR
ncbi:MAG: hypothetical protein WA723_19505 [Pseudolabrys sp.]